MLVEKVKDGSYITREFVEERQITLFTIENEGEIVTFEREKGGSVEKISLGVSYEDQRDDDPKTWTMNNKSRNAIIDLFGSETKNWVGRKVEIKIEGSKEYRHIAVDMIRTRRLL